MGARNVGLDGRDVGDLGRRAICALAYLEGAAALNQLEHSTLS